MNLLTKHLFLHFGIVLAVLSGASHAATVISAPPSATALFGDTKTLTITPTSSPNAPVFSARTSGTRTSCRIVSSTRNTVTYEALYPTAPTNTGITCTIFISQDGDGVTPNATKEVPITISKATQTISAAEPQGLFVDGVVDLPFTVTVTDQTTGSSNAITAIATTNVTTTPPTVNTTYCKIESLDPLKIKGIAPTGTTRCRIVLKKAGDDYYLDAPPKNVDITIGKGLTGIQFTNMPETLEYGKPFPLEVSKTGSTGAVTGSTDTGAICTVTPSGTKFSVKGIGLGICKVIISVATDTKYLAATDSKQLTIIQANQNLTLIRDNNSNLDPSQTSTVTLNIDRPSGLNVPAEKATVSTNDISICKVDKLSDGVYWVTAQKPGACYVTAIQPGNDFYKPGTTTLPIIINKYAQVVGISSSKTIVVDEEIPLTVTGGGSAAPVSLLTNDISLCTLTQISLTNYTLRALRGGNCMISATQLGDELHADAITPPYIVAINKKVVPIVFNYTPDLTVGKIDSISVTGNATNSQGMVTTRVKFKTSTPGCEVITDPVTFVQKVKGKKFGTNNCTIEAWRDEDDFNAKAGPVFQTFSVYKGIQEISVSSIPASVNVGGTIAVSATGSLSGSQLNISVPADGPCTIALDPATSTDKRTATVTANRIGNCVITAEQAATSDYEAGAASVQTRIKNKQILTFTNPLPVLAVNDIKNIGATSTNSTIPVILTSRDTSVCTLQSEIINNVTVYKVRAENATVSQPCTIAANQEGNTDYDAASEISVMLNIAKASQTISFLPLANATISDRNRLIAASATSGLPVSISAAPINICTMDITNKEMVNFISPGLCTITVSQAGNANFNSATSVVQNLQILPPASSIALTSSINPVMIRKNVTLNAVITGATPGGTVSFIADGVPIANCSLVTVASGKATCTTNKLKAGKRSIVASYSGDANNQSSQSAPFIQTVRGLDWLNTLLNQLLD